MRHIAVSMHIGFILYKKESRGFSGKGMWLRFINREHDSSGIQLFELNTVAVSTGRSC